jgi:hypothetical protein
MECNARSGYAGGVLPQDGGVNLLVDQTQGMWFLSHSMGNAFRDFFRCPEGQRSGCCTVFPFFNGKILELPTDNHRDYSLFHTLGDYSIELWKKQIDRIPKRHGSVSSLFRVPCGPEIAGGIQKLLAFLSQMQREKRPGDVKSLVARTRCRQSGIRRRQMAHHRPGRERARIAFAHLRMTT